ncbi:MAG: glycosyltransferase [Bacteroidota bacterium]
MRIPKSFSTPPRILILSASGGAGHVRAGEALKRTAEQLKLPVRADHFDCLDFTSRIFKAVYANTYLSMVNRIPDVWGYLYGKAESKPYRKGILHLFDHFNYQRYLRFLRADQPDAIVCTHFLPYISVSNVLRSTGIQAPVFAVTTDFDAHQYWIDSIIERYYVHDDESGWQLCSKGVSPDRIRVTGIPLMPEFRKAAAQPTSRRSLKLPPKRFTALILSGGFGVGRIAETVGVTLGVFAHQASTSFTLLVVCGKNEKVKSQLEAITVPKNVTLKVFGYVDTMHTLMAAADVVITKAGGLTSAEAMARKLPMIIVNPIPGQETRNADMIVERGAGWKALNMPNLAFKLRNVLRRPALLREARTATSSLARPRAAELILSDVLHLLHARGNAP